MEIGWTDYVELVNDANISNVSEPEDPNPDVTDEEPEPEKKPFLVNVEDDEDDGEEKE